MGRSNEQWDSFHCRQMDNGKLLNGRLRVLEPMKPLPLCQELTREQLARHCDGEFVFESHTCSNSHLCANARSVCKQFF